MVINEDFFYSCSSLFQTLTCSSLPAKMGKSSSGMLIILKEL